jgi:glycosyltransferase involved in cell wall biosynthesis
MRQDRILGLLLTPDEQEPDLQKFRKAQMIWKALPIPTRLRAMATAVLYRLSKHAGGMARIDDELAPFRALVPKPPADIPAGSLILSAYLSDTSGIGRGGRMSLDALRAAGLQPILHDLRREPAGWGGPETGGVWFAHCNAPEAADFMLRAEDPRACYRIGYWAWELPNLPADWVNIASLFHEIWAPSRFITEPLKQALKGKGPVVRRVPHPRPSLEGLAIDRARFGMADKVFTFLCMYDVHSSAVRKNPMAVVKAFQLAFDPLRTDVALLIKVVAADESRSCVADLTDTLCGWPNIRLMTDMLSDEDANVLIGSADAFVSLHRAEGFGLSIAQAMAWGRPVIVTGWSGNMDFCDEGAATVGFELIPVSDPDGPYQIYAAPGQVWADPDVEDAARKLRAFADDPAEARALGERGRRHVNKVLPVGYDVAHLKPWLA